MSDDLFAYLNDLPCGPIKGSAEYAYLGHFSEQQWLEAGHNELGLEQQIDAGNIPDLHAAGRNQPAESEPGNIANEGSTAPSMNQQPISDSAQPKRGGLGKLLGMLGGGPSPSDTPPPMDQQSQTLNDAPYTS